MKFQLWAGALFGLTFAARLAVEQGGGVEGLKSSLVVPKDEDNFEGVNISITPWSSFDLLNPVMSSLSGLSSQPGTTAQERIFRIVEKLRFGKMPDFEVYDAGTLGARLPRPILFYKHDSKLMGFDVNIKSSTNMPLLEWRGYRKTSRRSMVRAFITSAGKGMGNETYHTMTYLSRHGAKQARTAGELVGDEAIGEGKQRSFLLDAGRCPSNKKSECGKRLFVAQGGKQMMKIFSPESSEAVAHSERVSRKKTPLGKADTYELTVLEGHDPLLLANFACFVTSANHVETRRKQAVQVAAGAAAAATGGAVVAPVAVAGAVWGSNSETSAEEEPDDK